MTGPAPGSPRSTDVTGLSVLGELRISEERHRLLAEHAQDVIWTMALDGRITYVSPAVKEMRGITPEEAMAQPLEEIHPPESRAVSSAYFERLFGLLAAGLPLEEFRGQLEYYRHDGSTVWTEVHVIPHVDVDGTPIEIIGVTRDISERKSHEAELHRAHAELASANEALQAANAELTRLATTDGLTQTHNRWYFEREVASEVLADSGRHREVTLLLVDVDNLKSVNDAHGHLVGDIVLVEAVRRIRSVLRGTDVLARWGGDEFIVLLRDCPISEAGELAERIRASLAAGAMAPVGRVSVSIGMATLAADESADGWLQRADQALYAAKAAGRNTVRPAAPIA